MKNKFLLQIGVLITVLLSHNGNIKAQYVTIPNSSFASFLESYYPGCMMNDNQLDTTCNQIMNEDSLIFYSFPFPVNDITGIKYFDNLEYLNCQGKLLENLPELPESLKSLNCSFNSLQSLNNLPSKLIELNCTSNPLITYIPTLPDSLKVFSCESLIGNSSFPTLPTTLTYFSCFNNPLAPLPEFPETLKYLDCSGSPAGSIPAVLPSSLEYLYCSYNELDALPVLPSSLIVLSCGDNNLSILPELPESLTSLSCEYNSITSLPLLPQSLEILYCSGNPLTILPPLPISLLLLRCFESELISLPELPESLKYIDVSLNMLQTLPNLPDSLQELYCQQNQISNTLPDIPNSTQVLDCSQNELTALSQLSQSLAFLDCSENLLTSLPILPQSLATLRCYNNQIVYLPQLPNLLYILSCSSNLLTSLPELPSTINNLGCENNNISCFPPFPLECDYLFISNNPFTCVPNYIQAMSPLLLNIPLCEFGDFANNPNNCEGSQGIEGIIFDDLNENCTNDSSDILVENIPVYLFDGSNSLVSTAYTSANGGYSFYQFSGTYTVVIDTLNQPYTSTCLNVGLDSTFILNNNTLIDSINFAINCKPGIDLGIQSLVETGLVFPGQPHQLNVSAGDLLNWYNLNCASGTSGTVQINVTGSVAYTGTPTDVLVPDVVDGNNFTYNIADFGALPLNSFGMLFLTDTTAQAGEEICVTTTVTSNGTDNDTTNNTLTYCYAVVNSYDPNEKEVYPTSVLPGYDGYFTYTIHFQNTGSAPAINIKVQDTLSTNLDLSTFKITAYSHPNNTNITGNLVSFKFPNIWLPDSTSDLEGSKGFIQYKIKPLPGLPVGTQITNTAYIYFDYNDPIQTNITTSNFEIINGIKTYSKGKVSIYPNPNNGIFHVNLLEKNQNEKTMELTNLMGEKIWSQKTRSNAATIDIDNFPKGIYILNITDSNNHYIERVVKN